MTEVAGFLTLMLAAIALMKQVAVIMSFWMACIALAGIVTPILCCYMPGIGRASEEYLAGKEKSDWLERTCIRTARFCMGKGKYLVIVLCLAVLGLGAWQSTKTENR